MSLLKRYYILFLCVNIFLPKLNLGFGSFYFFEIINLILFALFILRGKVLLDSVTLTYFIFIFIGHLSYIIGYAQFGFFDATSYARLLKFTFFIFYILAPYFLLNKVSERDILKVLNWQFIFFLTAGAYVVYNMITDPKPIHYYVWEYSNENRLIGLTGYGIDLTGKIAMLQGSTSVAMGVYIAFVFLMFLSIYHFYGGRRNLAKVCILIVLEFLVYSRSGLLVMGTGLLYYFAINAKPATILKVAGATCLIVVTVIFFNLGEKITQAGSLNKLFSMSVTQDPRYRMAEAAYNHMSENPQVLFLGGGYGEKYTKETIGYTQLEGLLPTTLISSGVFAVLILCLHFFIVWYYSRNEYFRRQNEYSVFLYGMRLFVPGWALTALIAGNTFQTDFYFPVIYFVFVTSYYLSKKSSIEEKSLAYDSKKY